MSSIDVRLANDADLAEWDRVVDASAAGTVHHTLPWLHALERTSGYRLQTLVASRSGRIVGVFPFFLRRNLGVVTLTSPPPRSAIQFLGPLFLDGSPVRRKAEAGWLEFAGAMVDFLNRNYGYHRLAVRASLPLGAARAFAWRRLAVQPAFTYVIPLDPPLEEIRSSCSSAIRRSLARCEVQGYSFEPASEEDVGTIYEQVQERYREQRLPPPYSRTYLDQLWRSVDRSRLVAFKLVQHDRYVTGMICTVYNGTISFWSGLPRMASGSAYVNDYFHWKVILWARERGLHSYDLVGANTENIAAYKMKFSPIVKEYYQITGERAVGRLAYSLYRRFVSRSAACAALFG